MMVVFFVTAAVLRILTPTQTPPPSTVNSWKGVTPGYSTLQEAEQKLGPPIKTEQTDQGTQASYTSVFPAQPNFLVADKQNTVQFIKEQVLQEEGGVIDDYIHQFGQPDLTLIDKDTGEADRAYVFLKQGVVIVAHIAGPVEQRWYFNPTDKETFLSSWGKTLMTESDLPNEGGF